MPNRFQEYFSDEPPFNFPSERVWISKCKARWGLGSRTNPMLLELDGLIRHHSSLNKDVYSWYDAKALSNSLKMISQQCMEYQAFCNADVTKRVSANRMAACQDLFALCMHQYIKLKEMRSERARAKIREVGNKVMDLHRLQPRKPGPQFPTIPMRPKYHSEMHAVGTVPNTRHAATAGAAGEAGFENWLRSPTDDYWQTTAGQMSATPTEDDRFLFDYMDRCEMSTGFRNGITYIPNREKHKFLAIFENQQWVTPYSDGPSTRTDGKLLLDTAGRHVIYAMDNNGQLYVQPNDANTLNHCSFLSGQPVVCAGEIEFKNGKLVYISNGSGHYRPQTEQLRQAIRVLQFAMGHTIDRDPLIIEDHSVGEKYEGVINFLTGNHT